MKKNHKVRIKQDASPLFGGRVATVVCCDDEGCVLNVGDFVDETGEEIEAFELFFEHDEMEKL